MRMTNLPQATTRSISSRNSRLRILLQIKVQSGLFHAICFIANEELLHGNLGGYAEFPQGIDFKICLPGVMPACLEMF